MQPSGKSCSIGESCYNNGELEEGEIEENGDDDEDIWKQIESLEPPNTSSPVFFDPNSGTSTTIRIEPSSSSSTPSSSSAVLTGSQTADRIAGGFWAKLKSALPSSGGINTKVDNAAFGSVRAASDTRKTTTTIPHWAEDRTSKREELDASRSSPADVIMCDQAIQFDKHHQNDQFRRTDSTHGKESLYIERSDSAAAVDDEDELLELQLRLEALQSTMRRTSEKLLSESNERPTRHFDRRERRTGRQKPSKSTNEYSSDDRRTYSRRGRDSPVAAPFRPLDSSDRTRSSSSSTKCLQQQRRHSQVSSRRQGLLPRPTSRKKQHSASADADSEHRAAASSVKPPATNDNVTQLQEERERILSLPDPRQQLFAFLDLLIRPRTEAPILSNGGSFENEDSTPINSKDISDSDVTNSTYYEHEESAKCSPALPSSLLNCSGSWRRLTSCMAQGGVVESSSPLRRDLENRKTETSSRSSKIDDAVDSASVARVAIANGDDDVDEDEMEALRELALKSMLKAKAKKNDAPAPELGAQVGQEYPMSSAEQSAPGQSPYSNEGSTENDRPTPDSSAANNEEEETEFVITLNQKILRKSVQLARRRRRQLSISARRDKPKDDRGGEARNITRKPKKPIGHSDPSSTSSPLKITIANERALNAAACNQSGAMKTSSTLSSLSGGVSSSFYSSDKTIPSDLVSSPYAKISDLRQQRPRPVVKNNIMQFVKVIHKPLVIPLDDSDSDDDQYFASDLDISKNVKQRVFQKKACQSGDTILTTLKGGDVIAVDDRRNEDVGRGESKDNSAGPSNGITSLTKQLEDRLRMCVDDLTKHQNNLSEDNTRLRTLESLLRRYSADLQQADVKADKLKRELRRVESQRTSYKATVAKFKLEIQNVQKRVNKNTDLQQLYLRQWKEIEQLVSKHKIDVLGKPSIAKNDSNPLQSAKAVPAKRKLGSSASETVSAKRTKKASSKPPVETAARITTEDVFMNPLRWFKCYRLSPLYRAVGQYKLDSATFANKLDPSIPLCPFALSGVCLDSGCVWQHEKDYLFNDVEMITDLVSYRPDAVAEGADEEKIMKFAKELLHLFGGSMTISDVLLYCLSKIQTHASDTNGPGLAVDVEERRWRIGQSRISRPKPVIAAIKEPNIGSFIAQETRQDQPTEEAAGKRYFAGFISSAADPGKEVPSSREGLKDTGQNTPSEF